MSIWIRFLLGGALLFTLLKGKTQDGPNTFIKYFTEMHYDSALWSLEKAPPDNFINTYTQLTTLFFNAGQKEENIDHILSRSDSSHSSLILAVYHLFHTPSSPVSYQYLSQYATSPNFGKDRNLVIIYYLTLFELYKNNIVQSGEDYEKYLKEYFEYVRTPSEKAWYHLHYLEFLVKPDVWPPKERWQSELDELDQINSIYRLSGPLMAYFNLHKALIHKTFKEYDTARKYYLKAIELSQGIEKLKYERFISHILLAEIESNFGNFELAKGYLKAAKKYHDRSDTLRSKFVQDRWSAYYYYVKVEQWDSAFYYLNTSIATEHQLDRRRNELLQSEQSIKLQTARTENELMTKSRELAVEQSRLRITLIGTVAIMIISLILFISLRKIRSKNSKIELLMRELHHRVKNNLQIVSSLMGLQTMQLKDESAKNAISSGKGRIRAMSLIHQKLYQDDDVTSLYIEDFIVTLVKELRSSYGLESKIQLSFELPPVSLDSETALPIGLIINELVSNAFKYAFNSESGHLKIALKLEKPNKAMLSVIDSGKQEIDVSTFNKGDSFGTKLVHLLVKQLNGSIEFTYDDGLQATIVFKLRTQ